jgi:hypothetical protein
MYRKFTVIVTSSLLIASLGMPIVPQNRGEAGCRNMAAGAYNAVLLATGSTWLADGAYTAQYHMCMIPYRLGL